MTIFATQNSNLVFASPDGSNGTPDFRALTANDLPSTLFFSKFHLNANTLNVGTIETLLGNGIFIPANTLQNGNCIKFTFNINTATSGGGPNGISLKIRAGANGNISDPTVIDANNAPPTDAVGFADANAYFWGPGGGSSLNGYVYPYLANSEPRVVPPSYTYAVGDIYLLIENVGNTANVTIVSNNPDITLSSNYLTSNTVLGFGNLDTTVDNVITVSLVEVLGGTYAVDGYPTYHVSNQPAYLTSNAVSRFYAVELKQ